MYPPNCGSAIANFQTLVEDVVLSDADCWILDEEC